MKFSSKISESIDDWTNDQFEALLLVHAGHADLDYSLEERHKILEYINEEDLNIVEQYYHQKTDGQILQIILKYKSVFFQTPDAQQDILQKLLRVFEADGVISKLEKNQYNFIGRLITDSDS